MNAAAPKLQQALDAFSAGRLAQAEDLCTAILAADASQFDARHLLALIQTRTQRLDAAIQNFEHLLALRQDIADLWSNYGHALAEVGHVEPALASYTRALYLRPSPMPHVWRGNVLANARRPAEAIAAYNRALAMQPDDADALNYRGMSHEATGNYRAALADYERALLLRPNDIAFLANRGLAHESLKNYELALRDYDLVLAADPARASIWTNRGLVLEGLKLYAQALDSYERALQLQPDDANLLNNCGNALLKLERQTDALASYDRALRLEPDHAVALSNRAVLLAGLGRHDEALRDCDRSLAIAPDNADTHNIRGIILEVLHRFDEALASYQIALQGDPPPESALSGVAGMALKLCDWARTDMCLPRLVDQVTNNTSLIQPFMLLGYPVDAQLQMQCAQNYIAREYTRPAFTPITPSDRKHDKIRIAYLSADFCRHATTALMAQLLETHSRRDFEWHAISFSRDDGSMERQRIVAAFDHFHDVRALSDKQIAQRMRELEIDIAIDLKGFTLQARPAILAYRPAPVQVNYLGYPGTMGASFIDYIIADKIILPFDRQAFFAEKIVHLPHCYQPNDLYRPVAAHRPARADVGLPEEAFVFCGFHNSYKITRPVFDVWMRLLHAVNGSVLWLLADGPVIENNLRRAAAARDVDPGRLIFAPNLPMADHLARKGLADLFLDTLPVNAHTTASDAMWIGLPMITCQGETFVSRVASSVLYHAGVPDLVMQSLAGYERLALELAQNPDRLAAIRSRLAAGRANCPLFDIASYREEIEAAYRTMWTRWRNGGEPEAFTVAQQG